MFILCSCNSVIRVNVYVYSYRTAMTFLFLWLLVSDKYTAARSDTPVLVLFLEHLKFYTMVWFISMIRMRSAWNDREHFYYGLCPSRLDGQGGTCDLYRSHSFRVSLEVMVSPLGSGHVVHLDIQSIILQIPFSCFSFRVWDLFMLTHRHC